MANVQLPPVQITEQELLAVVGDLQIKLNVRESQLITAVQERDALAKELADLKEPSDK